MIEKIDAGKLSSLTKEESKEYWVKYANEELLSFFRSLNVDDRNSQTDGLVLSLMLYIINHYETYQAECSIEEKQKLLFGICRAVPLLTNTIISGEGADNLVDKYVIRHQQGVEDNNIFRDLKYLQKITVQERDNSPKFYGAIKGKVDEIEGMLQDVTGPLKEIIKLELDSTKNETDKAPIRNQYLDVKQYPNIFTLASFYREEQRLEDAKSSFETAINTFLEENLEKKIFAVLRAITIVGEFSSQKNLAFQTRLNNPEFIKSLEQIKKLTDIIVKPQQYDIGAVNTHNFDMNGLFEELKLLFDGLKDLIVPFEQTTYQEKVSYYTNPSVPKIPYLPQNLIRDLNAIIPEVFSYISQEQKDEINSILTSDTKQQFIKLISEKCKPQESNFIPKYREGLKAFNTDEKYKQIVKAVKDYKLLLPPISDKFPFSTQLSYSLLKWNPLKPIKDSCNDIINSIKNFLRPVNDLPPPMEDDNPVKLLLTDFKVVQDTKASIVVMKTGQHNIKVNFEDDNFSTLENAINSIKSYNTKNSNSRDIIGIHFPREFFEIKGQDKDKYEVDPNQFQKYINEHKENVVDYIINYGKFCNLCEFISKDDNKLAIEFLLPTSYNLFKIMKEQNPDFNYKYPEQEYRALRHGVRHFEDNLDVMENPVPIEEIHAHYTLRIIGEEAI